MILKRIREYLLHRNLSFNKFEISLGVSHGSISNAWKRQKNIGSNVIENILEIYPEVSAEWLLRGEGDMLNNNDNSELIQKDSTDENLNEELILQTLHFFNFQKTSELQTFLSQSLDSNSVNTLEQTILSTWEKKYGQELKSIKIQLMTLFTNKIDREQKAKIVSTKSNVA